MYLYILIFIKKFLKFSFYVVGINTILLDRCLQAVARCQATIDEQNRILKEVLATVKSNGQGQTSRTEEFAPINNILSDFDELNKKVECEQQFEKLLVS